MRSGGVLLAARDLERTKTFYQEVLGLEVVADYGTNVALTGGLSLQMLGSWAEALGKGPADIAFGGDTGEVYFVAEDYDAVLKALREHPDVELVHPPME